MYTGVEALVNLYKFIHNLLLLAPCIPFKGQHFSGLQMLFYLCLSFL